MARTPDNDVPRETQIQVRLTQVEKASIERTSDALGLSPSEAVRELPRIAWERDVLLDASFPNGLRREDLSAILDVMNGQRLLVGPESGDALLGEKLYADLADHGDEGYAELARRVEALPHAQRVALEVWAMMLWERSDDDAYWAAEIAKRASDGAEAEA